MEQEFLSKLNPMQGKACQCTEGPLLILAGAGSGKTRVLTYRIANLISKSVPPENIFAITFTNKAASEMRERVINLVPEGKRVWVSTFHAACVRILRKEINKIGYVNQFTINDADDSTRLIKRCMAELNINDKLFPVKSMASQISKFKDELLSPSDALKESEGNYSKNTAAQVYRLYQKRLKDGNSLDFDDIIFKTVELFVLRPDILAQYQERFKYIMVDEYQDTNTAQYHFVRMLAEKYKNICVVGDDDQSIYGWRGANIKNILDFEKRYPNAVVIKLEQNYRSTKTILECANSVIKNNPSRKDKKLWTESEPGEKVLFFPADSDYDEARFITDEIKKMAESGASLSDFAVLYRVNATSRVLEEGFVKSSLNYRIFGGVNFYARREVKDILAYLKLIYNKSDSVAFERIVNVPKRGIGDSSVDKLRKYASENEMNMLDAASEAEKVEGLGGRAGKVKDFAAMIDAFTSLSTSLKTEELIKEIIGVTNFKGELINEEGEDARERIENIDALISKAHEYDAEAEEPSLAGFLEDVSLVADIDGLDEKEDAVFLMTLHNCKGLEFPYVFMAGFEDGLLPGYRSITSGNPADIEEERRLCYVGITRAEKKLYLTAAKKRMQAGVMSINPISRFYDEIDKKLLDTVKDKYKVVAPAREKTPQAKPSSRAGKEQEYSYKAKAVPTVQRSASIDFEVGDMVSHIKFGTGEVLDIYPDGADFEITIKFQGSGIKKIMAGYARLKKV